MKEVLQMGLSKKEVNLQRLLAAAPNQQNQVKLVHYVTTSRELLEQIEAEAVVGGISSISKVKLNEYSEKIEALAARLSVSDPEPIEAAEGASVKEIIPASEITEMCTYPTPMLRRRTTKSTTVDENDLSGKKETGSLAKLDAEAYAYVEKHRVFQEVLTGEMVTLAEQLKESSLMMNKSLNETEKILDSTGKAVENSLASTGRANARAAAVYSKSSKTVCFTWLIIAIMMCLFIMVVLLIRIT